MAEEESKEQAKEGGGKNKLVMFIIIGVVVFLLLIGGVVAFLMMGSDEAPPAEGAPAGKQAAAPAQKAGGGGKANSNLLTIGPMYPLEQFIVNLMTQSGRRYLKVVINLELSQPLLSTELDTKKAVIRDRVIDVLSSKSIEEISTVKGKEKLKEEILERLNEFIVDGRINNLFFTEFVIQ